MQQDWESLFRDFEEAFGCRVTLHDPLHLLSRRPDLPPLPMLRTSHRKTFPCQCGKESREYCIEHCMFQFNRWAERQRRRVYYLHCRNGFWQIAVPLFRNNVHVLNLFAGLWTKVEDRPKWQRIARMLPVFAEGLFQQLAQAFPETPQNISTTAARIRAFIAHNYHRPLQTRDMARHLALSVSRTCALLQQECHTSFKELLTRERMRHAKLYLAQSDLRIKEISLLCGFASQEHFQRVFRQCENTSPGQWRSAALKRNEPRTGEDRHFS